MSVHIHTRLPKIWGIRRRKCRIHMLPARDDRAHRQQQEQKRTEYIAAAEGQREKRAATLVKRHSSRTDQSERGRPLTNNSAEERDWDSYPAFRVGSVERCVPGRNCQSKLASA